MIPNGQKKRGAHLLELVPLSIHLNLVDKYPFSLTLFVYLKVNKKREHE